MNILVNWLILHTGLQPTSNENVMHITAGELTKNWCVSRCIRFTVSFRSV